jgi:hypothetical protein
MKKVTVTVTLFEAENMAFALDEGLRQGVHLHKPEHKAAARGLRKLEDALLAPQRPPTVKEPHEDPI